MNAKIPLPERIDLARAGDLQSTLVSQIGTPLTLDARAVQHIGTPGLQVLIAAAKTWRSNGHSLTIGAPSPRFQEMLTTAGLTLSDLTSPAQETPQ